MYTENEIKEVHAKKAALEKHLEDEVKKLEAQRQSVEGKVHHLEKDIHTGFEVRRVCVCVCVCVCVYGTYAHVCTHIHTEEPCTSKCGRPKKETNTFCHCTCLCVRIQGKYIPAVHMCACVCVRVQTHEGASK